MENFQTLDNNVVAKLKATFGYVLLGVLFAGLANFLMLPFAGYLVESGLYWGVIIAEFAVIFAFFKWKNLGMLLLFTGLTGASLAPIIELYLAKDMGYVIVQALLGTSVMVGGIALYAITTKRDFYRIGPMLFWALVALLVVMVLNIFIGSSILSLSISYIAVLLFSVFLIHDIQETMYTDIEPLDAALGIYLDILNMFVHLLNILGMDTDD